jgi:hypothetical protein
MKLVGCLVPSLYLSGGNVSECCLLLLDLLADGIEVGFDPRFENVPLRFQLRPGALRKSWKHTFIISRLLRAGKCQARTQIRFRGMTSYMPRRRTRAKEFAGPQKPTIEKDLSGFNAI